MSTLTDALSTSLRQQVLDNLLGLLGDAPDALAGWTLVFPSEGAADWLAHGMRQAHWSVRPRFLAGDAVLASAETPDFSGMRVIVYAPIAWPEVLQPMLLKIRSEAVACRMLPMPLPSSHAVIREVIRETHPYQEETRLLELLQAWQAGSSAPEETLILCPSLSQARHLAYRLQRTAGLSDHAWRIGLPETMAGVCAEAVAISQAHHFFRDGLSAGLERLQAFFPGARRLVLTVNPDMLGWAEQVDVEAWLEAWRQPDTLGGMAFPAELQLMLARSSTSPWNQPLPQPMPLSTEVSVLGDAVIRLSPSSVAQFLACPRQFYYQHLLGLTEVRPPSPQAAYGMLTHRLLEVFNREFARDYTLENLVGLTRNAFDAIAAGENGLAQGLTPRDALMLSGLSDLQRDQVQQDLEAGFQGLAAAGYFDQPFTRLHVEQRLSSEAADIFDDAGFQLAGRADLIRETPSGTLEIVDYKTSRSQFASAKVEANRAPLLRALEPIDWDAADVADQLAGRQFQLPLYALMAQSTPGLENRPVSATIQVVRPVKPDDPGASACHTLTLDAQELAAGEATIREMLIRAVAQPMREAAEFVPLGDRARNCPHCAYNAICEGPAADADEAIPEGAE